MKQGDTITISGEFEGLTGIETGYTVMAMIYCQDAKVGFKKLLFGYPYNDSVAPYSGLHGGPITLINPNRYSFEISSNISAKLQGECQVELSLTQGETTAISDNYATFSIQNSVLGTTVNG